MLACYKRLPFRVCTRTLPNKTYTFPPLIRAYPHKQTNLELSQFETSKSVKKLYGDNLSALGTIYSGTSPLGHLYPRDTSIQGTQNLVAKKCLHNLCVSYLYWRDTFRGSRNPGLTSIQGTTLALKKWLATKIIDKFKCTLATAFKTWAISPKSMYSTIQHTTSQK